MAGMLKNLLLFWALGLAMPAVAQEPSAKEKTIAAIEAAGCQLDPSNSDAVLDMLGFSPEVFRAIGKELVAEGRADTSTFGVFRLTTEACRKAPE